MSTQNLNTAGASAEAFFVDFVLHRKSILDTYSIEPDDR